MFQNTKNYISQYKVLFYLSWICLYLIYPTWINLHSIFQDMSLPISQPVARSVVILGMLVYFIISSYFINRYFNALMLDKPIIIKFNDWSKTIKSNIWLAIVCCLAVILHIHSFSLLEVGYLRQGVWMYDFSNKYWHILFDFPIQYGFWFFIVLWIVIIKQKKMINFITNYISAKYVIYKSNKLLKLVFLIILFGFFSAYSYLFPYYGEESLQLLRFAPVSHYLNLITYYAFGISQLGPRIMQLMFYILGAIYIYRTIYLFRAKEAALLGATIYLFSPVIFHYASLTFLVGGTVFFMVLISFYFLRFIKCEDSRDLILTVYFIGLGFLYRGEILVLFMICFAYFALSKIIRRDRYSIIHFKILSLSLISIMPFLIIGRIVKAVYYEPALSNLITIDTIFMVIQSQISAILSLLLLLSICYILVRRDDLSLFYGFYFIAYYIFFTIGLAPAMQRYSTALYPAIAVLLAQSIFDITQRPGYKHLFKLSFSILTVYLIFLCLVPRSATNLITFKYRDYETQQYPFEKAVNWILRATKNDEKVLLIIPPGNIDFYVKRIRSDRDRINQQRFIYYPLGMATVKDLIYPITNLKAYCHTEKISYFVLPFGPNNFTPDLGAIKEVKYLKENSDQELKEAARFNHEDNYLIIYKIK